MDILNKLRETADFIKQENCLRGQRTAIILGSGLGMLGDEITDPYTVPYSRIPHFPVSTVPGHKGQLIFGSLAGVDVICMQGRFHYYEGYGMEQVTYPVRLFRELGIENLIVSNAAGGLNPDYRVGDLMLIKDHINFFPEHPLRGANLYGDRFPDMSEPYSKLLRSLVLQTAEQQHIGIHEGVYVGTQGPSFETPAELRMFRSWGADAVGMSTVPEVIVARHADINVMGVSVITDLCVPDAPLFITHEEVQQAADGAAPHLTKLIKAILPSL